jgi:RNA polymerase sigma factor (sigma-70 family)
MIRERFGEGLEASDYQLVERFLAGERDAFAEIFARYKKLVYNTIYNFMGESSEVNDLFQEAFLKIYKSLARYNPEYRFSTWTIRITTNVCLDRLRQARPEHAAMDDIEEVGDDRLDPEGQCLARERTERVRKALRELPEEYRTPVILFHQQGLSYEAMVEVLGQPMSIIKNRLYRARLMLRDRLGPDGKEEAST